MVDAALFKSSYPRLQLKGNGHVKQKRQWTVCLPVDIPTGWEPRTNKSPTGAFVAPPAVGPCCSSPLPHRKRKTSTHCVLVFLFCLRHERGSNRAVAYSAASNQPSGLLLSPRVPTRRNVYRGSCRSKDFMGFLFCKPWLHGFCTVFARSVLSMSDDVGRCIALQSVPFFVSGEQGQAELCLHFRVGILEQLQKSRHGG